MKRGKGQVEAKRNKKVLKKDEKKIGTYPRTQKKKKKKKRNSNIRNLKIKKRERRVKNELMRR